MKRLKKWRDKHLLFADAALAVVVAAGVVSLPLIWMPLDGLPSLLDGSRSASYATLASVAGSLLGFVITAVSIISVFGSLPRFRLLQQSVQQHAIFRVFFDTIYWLALGTTAALAGLVIDKDSSPVWAFTIAVIAIFAVVAARVWRCVWLLQAMSRIASQPIADTQPSPATTSQTSN